LGYTSKHGLEPGRRRIDAPANKWLLGPPSGSAAFACPRGRWLREQVPGNRSCVKRGARREVRPLAPGTVEALRAASGERDAALISVLAYAGLRPQKALALSWAHVRHRTLRVERAASLGELRDTMTRSHRTVRLLAPLAEDLAAWRRRAGR
jgi:integrase